MTVIVGCYVVIVGIWTSSVAYWVAVVVVVVWGCYSCLDQSFNISDIKYRIN